MKKFMIAALAAGMLTACSDSAVVETPAGGGAQWGADGTGYVSLSINLPKTTSAGRANGNDKFEDGLPSEYAVNDAVLLLFKGAGEASSTFQGAYKLPVHFASGDPTQITSTANITKRIKAITTSESDKIYAFVMLNAINNGIFTLDNSDEVEDYDWSDAKIQTTGGEQALTETTTFKNVQDMISELPTNIANGLIMVNAPLSNVGSQSSVAPSAGSVTILSTVDKGCIQTSAAAAASKPAAKVYVERTTAKVTLTGTDELSGDIANALLSESGPKLKYQVLGIALDNYNQNSYLVRNVSGYNDWYTLTSNKDLSPLDTKYRFVGNSAVDGKYRIYWAKDENYGDVFGGELKTDTITSPAATSVHEFIDIKDLTSGQVSKAMYCNENVFDVERMKWDNTTRAIIKVHLGTPGDNKDYIMWNDDSKTYKEYTSATGAGGAMAKEIVGLAAFRNKYGDSFDASKVTVSIEPTHILPNTYVVKTVTIDNGTPVVLSSTSGEEELKVFKAVKSYFGTINYFAKGIAYYQVLIQHFGNDLTPWNDGEGNPTSGGIAETYPVANRDANYLGRYGVLRNNWYNLTINGVNAIGTPYIPNVKSTENKDNPDDQLKSYISVEINILSWAKRDQGVILE